MDLPSARRAMSTAGTGSGILRRICHHKRIDHGPRGLQGRTHYLFGASCKKGDLTMTGKGTLRRTLQFSHDRRFIVCGNVHENTKYFPRASSRSVPVLVGVNNSLGGAGVPPSFPARRSTFCPPPASLKLARTSHGSYTAAAGQLQGLHSRRNLPVMEICPSWRVVSLGKVALRHH